ncbi:MAG: hypothetical protein N3G18_10545 [Candidatus Saccharicenans sp.]|nr:hypothetical protein [Candidatus Saccharicenans sp.]
MKIFARNRSLPLRPEPFVFRLEWKPGAEWVGPSLEEILAGASLIQVEAADSPDHQLLELLRDLDKRPEQFNLRLLARPGELGAKARGEFIESLSRLKKLAGFTLIVNSRADAEINRALVEVLEAGASAGLKPGVLVELEPETSVSELEQQLRKARLSGALEIALRPACLTHHDLAAAKALNDVLFNLRTEGIPVSLEECFPGLEPELTFLELNCRRGFGSCYIDGLGRVKACRQSEKFLGNLKQEKPDEIWPDYLFVRNVCPKDSTRNGFSEAEIGEAGDGRIEKAFPVNLDSSLRPVPLFTLKKKGWGAVLIKGLDGLVLSPRGEQLARLIDGQNTFRSIRKKFGQRSAGFIYALFLRGLVRLEK